MLIVYMHELQLGENRMTSFKVSLYTELMDLADLHPLLMVQQS